MRPQHRLSPARILWWIVLPAALPRLFSGFKLALSYALIGVTGIVRMALSALDMALWDALAVAAGLPLATMLGGAPRPLQAYNSCGLGLMTPEAAADEAEELLAGGFKAVKLRLGHATLAEDLAVTRAVRRRLADERAATRQEQEAWLLRQSQNQAQFAALNAPDARPQTRGVPDRPAPDA